MNTLLHSFDFLMDNNESDTSSHFTSISVEENSVKLPSQSDAFSSPLANTTPISNSPFSLGLSSPTAVSDISNYNAATTSACKTTANSMNFLSLYRQFDATERCYPYQTNLDTAASCNIWEDLTPKFETISIYTNTLAWEYDLKSAVYAPDSLPILKPARLCEGRKIRAIKYII